MGEGSLDRICASRLFTSCKDDSFVESLFSDPFVVTRAGGLTEALVWVSISQCGDMIVSEWPIVGEAPQRSNLGAIHMEVRTIAGHLQVGPSGCVTPEQYVSITHTLPTPNGFKGGISGVYPEIFMISVASNSFQIQP